MIRLIMKAKLLKYIEIILSVGILLWSIQYNLNLYKLEPTAKTDPNDNTFQFALVDRANTVWDFAKRQCPPGIFGLPCFAGYMVDHWVPNWAQGYNLPFYYSHAPQIAIVGTFRLLSPLLSTINHEPLTLFRWYHLVIYLLLCFFPLSVFLGLKAARLPWLTAACGAVLATHISTDGLYGLDPPSFLWRGYGLSSQLFAMIFMPLAIGFTWRFFSLPDLTRALPQFPTLRDIGRRTITEITASLLPHTADRGRAFSFWMAALFLALATLGHLGLGVMSLLSAGIIALSRPIAHFFGQRRLMEVFLILVTNLIRLGLLGGVVVFFLAYWVIPVFTGNAYHNTSFWDPIWKFNSYGWYETLIRLFNGDLFDWGRSPYYTTLVIVGAFSATGFILPLLSKKPDNVSSNDERSTINSYFPFTLLLAFWTVMYFGRTTWKGLIDLIPGMSEFHQSRFIVGLHLSGLLLAPVAISGLAEHLAYAGFKFFSTKKKVPYEAVPLPLVWVATLLVLYLFAKPIYKQTEYYNELNDRLIIQGNDNYQKVKADVDLLMDKLHRLPASRVFVGRGGGWGKDFNVAETEMFMYVSTYGINTALWLPETWSPNSDVEQFFSEDQARDYDLFNLKYVVAPPDIKPQPFWKLVESGNPFWTLYEVPTSGYFTVGTRTQAVVSDKMDYKNIVHQWIQSDTHKDKLFPQLSFTRREVIPNINVPVITMLDEVTYETQSGDRLNIFANRPLYGGDPPAARLIGQESVISDQIYKTQVEVDENCRECYVVLKQSSHPNWVARVNGKKTKHIIVFPFFIGVPVSGPGVYDISVSYEPHPVKIPLIIISWLVIATLILYPFALRRIQLSKIQEEE
jgi:hypothetical protein